MRYFLTTLTLLLCLSLATFAQKKELKLANKYYESFEYSKAIELYKEVLKKDKKNKNAIYALADCYKRTSKFAKAAHWYEKAVDLAPNDADLKFQYAQSLMSNGDYNQAKYVFSQYAEQKPNDSRTQNFIDWCNNVDSYLADSSLYKVEGIPTNSPQSDFGPAFFQNGLVFSSTRPTGSKDKLDGWTGETFLDLFYSKSDFYEQWGEVAELPGWSGSKFHDGPATFANENTKMYFSRNVRKKFNKGKIATLRIFESEFRDGKWSFPLEMSFNPSSNRYSLAHPSVTEDGTKIYFTADLPGGYGGKDIYVVEKTGFSWTSPQNLGSQVNTEGDDMFPYIHSDGTLYFASDGHGGFGGLDVFYVFKEDGSDNWSSAFNMGYPINSQTDDFGLILNPNKDMGFIASNRPGGKGSDDIYSVFIKAAKAEQLSSKSGNIAAVSQTQKQKMPRDSKITVVSYVPNAQEMANSSLKDRKDFFFIGLVQDYQSKKEVANKLVELVELETDKVQRYFTDKGGNFYFHLKENHRYVLRVRNAQKVVEDFREISVIGYDKGNIFHTILEVNKPKGLAEETFKEYTEKFGKGSQFIPESGLPVDTFVQDTAPDKGTYNPNPNSFSKPKPDPNYEGYKRPELPSSPNNVVSSYTPPPMNISYKIQIGAFNKALYQNHKYLRPINNEYIEEIGPRGVHRYLVGNYNDLDNAEAYQRYMKELGYQSAFIVIYVNNTRMELGIDEAPSDWLIR